jgi:hypothetical protein
MPYSTSNPPQVAVPGIGSAATLWTYKSTDASTVVAATGYFTNGKALGMKVDDFIMSTFSSSSSMFLGKVTTVSSTGVTVAQST